MEPTIFNLSRGSNSLNSASGIENKPEFSVRLILFWISHKRSFEDVFTHKDIHTYINGVVKICLNILNI